VSILWLIGEKIIAFLKKGHATFQIFSGDRFQRGPETAVSRAASQLRGKEESLR
jgi:hypothetical protein